MLRFVCVMGLAWAAALVAGLATAGPFNAQGPIQHRKYITIQPTDKWEFTEKFKGGQRACAIMMGDHDPVVGLTISVYDSQNKLVVKDDTKGDYAAVVWYPPRDETYHVYCEHKGRVFNKCWIVVK